MEISKYHILSNSIILYPVVLYYIGLLKYPGAHKKLRIPSLNKDEKKEENPILCD